MRKDRQQRANVKARKAKAAAAQAKQHRSWIDRKRNNRSAPRHAPIGSLHMLAALQATTHRPTAQELEAKERFLCRVFGEEYRP